MKDNPFSKFITLISIDQKIRSLTSKKIEVEGTTDSINQQKHQQDLLMEQARQKILRLKKDIDFQELEMKTFDSKEKEKKDLLNRLTDYRECQAIKNEIDAINRLQVAQEKVILDLWAQLESSQLSFEKQKVEIVDLYKKYKQELLTVEKNVESLNNQLTDLVTQRSDKLFGIPDEWLEKYNLMALRVENPVVSIEQLSCGGCYQQLTSQDIIRARRGALMQCKKCFRLLYLPEAVVQ